MLKTIGLLCFPVGVIINCYLGQLTGHNGDIFWLQYSYIVGIVITFIGCYLYWR